MGSRAAAREFERRLWFRSISHTLEISEDGLLLGAGTVLAGMNRDPSGAQVLALDRDQPRLLALLAVAYGRFPPSDFLVHLESAARFWKNGDKALANIRLAFARLPRLGEREESYRLFLAESLLDKGMTPEALVKLVGLAGQQSEIAKYDPDQPRVPAGSGQNSGQWTSGGDPETEQAARSDNAAVASTGFVLPSAEASGTLAQGLFTAVEGSEFLAGLGALAATIGTGAAFGAAFVWPGKSAISEGAVPGDSDLRYLFNNDEGTLRFSSQSASGSETIVVAHQGRDGIFFDMATGTPVARAVGGSLVFDAASLADVADEKPARLGVDAEAGAQSRADEPQLCPDPSPDVKHGASDRANAYQAQISALNNPQRPLPPGLAISLPDPTTGKRVVFDDCRESDGTMIEAKGPGFANMLRSRYFSNFVLPERWKGQAIRQVAASGGAISIGFLRSRRRPTGRASFLSIPEIYEKSISLTFRPLRHDGAGKNESDHHDKNQWLFYHRRMGPPRGNT